MINRYGTLAAWVYHLDKPIGHSFGDIEYYRDRLAACTGPILEPATGNGRVLIPLLEAGLSVTGFDGSEDMLAYCRQECRRRDLEPPLTRQQFEDFHYDHPFDAIILPAGSFQLITDTAVAQQVLGRFLAALAPGGRLLLDLDPMSSLIHAGASCRHWQTGDDLLTLQHTPLATDYLRQTTHAQLRYEHWHNGELARSQLETFHLRWWGVHEMTLALAAAGFADIQVCGDYRHGQVPGRDAGILTFEATRPG
ncbi:class I SAM-dependent methyltransferase [Marinobacter xestospongiae]|uniref:class I SAM-dependent methyltransferase n=1 Tax=Marinobacter xestospongiae TaxID=994319 RepID=UPI00200388FB|nr:class I SAM-dependent methyltransferase [Marinobacter xestospongiae]MCK7565685.1 class I SAM-dependent methyltransferase [Marinobacter xestospongiae]